MPRKQLEVPPAVARAFMKDLRAFFAAKNQIKADEIAIRQLTALNEYLGRRDRPLRVTDIKAMFHQMRDEV